MKKILFLNQNPLSKNTNSPKLVAELKQISPDLELSDTYYNDLKITIQNNKIQISNLNSNTDLSSYNLVIFASWRREPELATLCATYLEHHGIKFVDQEAISFRSDQKILDYVKLSLSGVPVPNTIWASNQHYLSIASTLTYPLILKDNYGSKGRNNYLIKSAQELTEKITTHPEVNFIIQEFIPNDFDYRFLVLGNQVRVVIKRTRKDQSTHLNNTSQDAKAELIDPQTFSPEIIQTSIQAAKAVTRQICGVDVIINSETQQYYILEANSWPQIRTGAHSEFKLKAFSDYIHNLIK